MPQQNAMEYLRHGQMPFFRLPMAELGARDHSPYAGAHAVLLGVPYDGGTTYQPGARLGPYHLRRVSALVQPYHRTHRVDVFGRMRVLDGGNVPVSPFQPEAMRAAVEHEVAAVLAAGAAPLLAGGDHTITLPALRAVAARHRGLAVVHIDAHLDASGPEVWHEAHHHGTPLRHALTEALVAPGQLYQLGMRGPWSSSEEGDFALAHGSHLYPIEDIEAGGVDAVMDHIRTEIGNRPVYVTIDIDAIDPAFAPGTGTPVPGGLTAREAFAMVRGLAGLRVVGADVVEIAPALDHADMTCHLGAHLLFEALALMAMAR